MPRKTCEERIDEAVNDAVRQERRQILQKIGNIEFTADSFTHDAVVDVIKDIERMIKNRGI